MNLIISIHSAGYRRHLIQLKEKLLVPSKWMLIQEVFLACDMKDLYVFKAKWPLAVYYCCNYSCYLIYRYPMWAKGKCHRLSGITPPHPLLGCWSHSFSNSQAQNIKEVLQMSRPAISFCALFSLCYLKCQKLDDKKPHSQQEHCLSFQGHAMLCLAASSSPQSCIYHWMTRASLRSWGGLCILKSTLRRPAKQIHWISCYTVIMLHKTKYKCEMQRSALLLAPSTKSEFSAILNNLSSL